MKIRTVMEIDPYKDLAEGVTKRDLQSARRETTSDDPQPLKGTSP